jgi:predicted nucleic acid-binding protein
MILVDTSVWVEHLRAGKIGLERFLNDGEVICHPLIVGELACGNLKNRAEILALMQTLPMAVQAEHDDVLLFIENNRLMGKGLGYIDMHLLASALLSDSQLWTLDKKLRKIAAELGIGWIR